MDNKELSGFALDGLNSILALPDRLLARMSGTLEGHGDSYPMVYAVTCWDYRVFGRKDTDRRLRVQAFRVIPEEEAQKAVEEWKRTAPQQGQVPSNWDSGGMDDNVRFYRGDAYAQKSDPRTGDLQWRVVTDVGPDNLRRVYVGPGPEVPTPCYGLYSIISHGNHPVTWYIAAEHLLSPEAIAHHAIEPDEFIEIAEWLDEASGFGDAMKRFWVYANKPEFVIERDFQAAGKELFYRPDWKPLMEEVKKNTPADGMPADSGSDAGSVSGLSMTIGDVDRDTPPPNSAPTTGLE